MNTIEKQLLLQDICARLPYDVIVEYGCRHEGKDLGEKKSKLTGRMIDSFFGNMTIGMSEVYSLQPYLRPMSSMTDKEKKELIRVTCGKSATKYFQVLSDGSIDSTDAKEQDLNKFQFHWINFNVSSTTSYIDWLNEHNFDYRGLIEKGLALEAPEGMYKTN